MNAEFKLFGFPSIDKRRVIDTLTIARQKFPGSPANLDALCRRFGIDNSSRDFHGALLDSELLAEVYLELLGGRQRGLGLAADNKSAQEVTQLQTNNGNRPMREARIFTPSDAELEAHKALLENLKDPVWNKA